MPVHLAVHLMGHARGALVLHWRYLSLPSGRFFQLADDLLLRGCEIFSQGLAAALFAHRAKQGVRRCGTHSHLLCRGGDSLGQGLGVPPGAVVVTGATGKVLLAVIPERIMLELNHRVSGARSRALSL